MFKKLCITASSLPPMFLMLAGLFGVAPIAGCGPDEPTVMEVPQGYAEEKVDKYQAGLDEAYGTKSRKGNK